MSFLASINILEDQWSYPDSDKHTQRTNFNFCYITSQFYGTLDLVLLYYHFPSLVPESSPQEESPGVVLGFALTR